MFSFKQRQEDFEPTAEAETHQRLKAMWSEDSSEEDEGAAGDWVKV